jgi:hypothetical protein
MLAGERRPGALGRSHVAGCDPVDRPRLIDNVPCTPRTVKPAASEDGQARPWQHAPPEVSADAEFYLVFGAHS